MKFYKVDLSEKWNDISWAKIIPRVITVLAIVSCSLPRMISSSEEQFQNLE